MLTRTPRCLVIATFKLFLNKKHLSTRVEANIDNVRKFSPSVKNKQKLLKVSIIGMPNAGKSTLINSLMDRKVCPTSSKAHTTRARSKAIFTVGDSQIVFLDTPGLTSDRERRRFNLEKSFSEDSVRSIREADIIGVIHDVSSIHTREKLDIKIVNLLEKHIHIPSFLVLNKIDILKSKRKLLDITRLITENHIDGKLTPGSFLKKRDVEVKGWKHFKQVFMVSSLTNNGLEEVKNYLISKAKEGKWMYESHIWTDQTMETVILSTVKANLLNTLPQEVPYELKPEIELLEILEDGISIVVLVKCPSVRKAGLVTGVGDGKLKYIIRSVQKDLEDAFQMFVRIKIVLDVPNK